MQPSTLSRQELVERICAGGFPDAVGRSPGRRASWFDGYVTTTIERVVRQLADIERAAEMPRLIRLCAARTAQATSTTVDRPGGPFGQLLETFVISEIRKQLTWAAPRVSMHHFRDRNGVEVDIVLEHPDGRIVGIEIKATSTPRAEDFRGLRFLAQRLGDRFAFGILLSAAPDANPFGPRLAAFPGDALWR